jgi:hypothetical protein
MAQDNARSNDRGDAHRDNDDVRNSLEGSDRAGTDPDTRSEARGNARANVGNTARDTDSHPTGPEGNDTTKHRPRSDSFDADLDTAAG